MDFFKCLGIFLLILMTPEAIREDLTTLLMP